MRTLYLDCHAGISGNMFAAALLDLGLDTAPLDAAIERLSFVDLNVEHTRLQKRGVGARFFDVKHHEGHPHRGLSDVLALVDQALDDGPARALAHRIFNALAQAEADVHETTVDAVHFHEVGAVDAIVDVIAAAVLLTALSPQRVVASRVRTGFGQVQCDHGLMPIPAPATARLMRNAPTFAGDVEGEFATPTGAAILSACVDTFGPQPTMTVDGIGYGAGSKDPPFANCVRAFVGETPDEDDAWLEEEIVEVTTHIDDMSGEALGALTQTLRDGAAVDVTLVAAQGKKNRPAFVLTVLCRPGDENAVLESLFVHSTTIGARVRRERRVALPREAVTLSTPFGEVAAKRVTFKGRTRTFPELDACQSLADTRGVPLDDVLTAARAAGLER